MPKNIDLILPCFNPPDDFVKMIRINFRHLTTYMPDRKLNLFVVNDGSTKNFTDIHIEQLRSIQESVHIISYSNNRGKGYALRKAVAETSSPLVVYTDYDFPFRVGCIIKVIEELDKDTDIVIVSRNHDYLHALPFTRKFYSLMSKLLNRVFLKLRYCETQGGLKGFNLKGKEIFMMTTINEFLFDTEFIYRASLQKDIRMVNVHGITREDIRLNRVPLRVIKREMINFFKILKLKAE